MNRLSALVITRNEEEMLPECLASLAFADEIVVVDSGSTDRTAELAEAAGAKVLTHEFRGHAAQKNWGLRQLAHDWAIVLDADERVPAELAAEIRARVADPDRAGYWIRRRNTFLGREITGCGWQRDKVLRLFDRRAGHYEEKLVHEEVRLPSEAGHLRHALTHHSCRDLGTWLEKTERYAALGAREARRKGRGPKLGDLFVRPGLRFLKQWAFQGGYRDGIEGLILCATSAYSVFLKYAYLRRGEEEA